MVAYKRVLLKISGEAFTDEQAFGVKPDAVHHVAEKIAALQKNQIQVGVVMGGGNIFRGIQQGASWGMERTPADQVGMLATLMNGVILQQALIQAGCKVQMMSALECPSIAQGFHWRQAIRYLEEGNITLFVGGTGHPYFTTDTVAALRACEIKADILLKATTRVDGVYDKDPRKHKDAKKYDQLSFEEALQERLGVMDLCAFTLCMAEHIPIRVFNFYAASFLEALTDETIGTIVKEK
ncbi:MAG: UMP kinase [Chlamydiales bacterium]